MTEPLPTETTPSPIQPVVLPGRELLAAPLPNPGTSFVGRAAEVRALLEMLRREDVRLVTLTGPGGVGKTRLGLQVARQAAASFPDGIVFVDLAPVPGTSGFSAIVASTLGIRDVAGMSIAERVIQAIHHRSILLFLDGFESHVREAKALATLIAQCERVTILATSREPIRLSTEWVREVSPLGVPDAGQGNEAMESEAAILFADRARAVVPDFAVDERTASEIGSIVRALDGLPLAIELAATRLTHLPPRALLQRLDHRMALLTGGALDMPERHQTLRRSIAWSYELLSPAEQVAYRRLAVFAGGFSLDGASRVIGLDDFAAVDLLGALVTRSMIRRVERCDGEPRFAMLDTLREYAAEQLELAGEVTATRDRHAAWFVAFAERADESIWGGPDHVVWLDRLQADLDNFRAALTWLESRRETDGLVRLAAALGGLWVFRSYPIEGRDWLRRALELDDGTNPLARAMACVKLAVLERQLGDGDTYDLSVMALELRIGFGDRQSIGRAYLNLGHSLLKRQDREGAIEAFRQAHSTFGEIGDIDGLGMSMLSLAGVALDVGDLQRADAFAVDSLNHYRQSGFANGEARALLVLGWIATARNETSRAVGLYANSLECWLKAQNIEGLVDALTAIAALAVDRDRPELAASLLGAAAGLGTMVGYVMPPMWQARWEQAEQQCRAVLGDAGYEAALIAGGGMSGEAAAELATSWLRDPAGCTSLAGTTPERPFTPREMDVLRLLVEGRSDREIASELGLKYRTVTSYVRNILDKLDASSRTEAATRAVREGMV